MEYTARAAKKARQGLAYRLLPYCGRTIRNSPQMGTVHRLITGVADSHTRSCYMSKDYATAVILWREGWTAWDQAYSLLIKGNWKEYEQCVRMCPLCTHGETYWEQKHRPATEAPRHAGNMDHLHKYCADPALTSARQCCNKWLGRACLRFLGTLLDKQGKELVTKALGRLTMTLKDLEIVSYRNMSKQVEDKKEYKNRIGNTNITYKAGTVQIRLLLELMVSKNDHE